MYMLSEQHMLAGFQLPFPRRPAVPAVRPRAAEVSPGSSSCTRHRMQPPRMTVKELK